MRVPKRRRVVTHATTQEIALQKLQLEKERQVEIQELCQSLLPLQELRVLQVEVVRVYERSAY